MYEVTKKCHQGYFVSNGYNYYKSKSKQESQKIRKKFSKEKGKCSKNKARKKCRKKKNRRSGGRNKLKLDTKVMTTDYSNDCIQEFFEKYGILPSNCDKNFYGYDSEPSLPTWFYSANAYKFIIDDIWINNIIFFLDIYDFISLNQTCCDLNKLLTTNIIQNVYWKIKCGVLLNTSFIPTNNRNDKFNSNCNNQSETFQQCFKPINNDWKQFYIEIRTILHKFRYIDGISRNGNCNGKDQTLEKWICKYGSRLLISTCSYKHHLMQMTKFLLDMNVIFIQRDQTKKNVKNKLNKLRKFKKLNKISLFGPPLFSRDVFNYVFENKRDDYAMLKLILNHEIMLYKDPKTKKYPIKSRSVVAFVFDYCNPRLLQIFFSKKFNRSIGFGIIDINAENHIYAAEYDGRTFKGGILTLACLLWSGDAHVECFKSLLSCKDMDLSNQMNENLFFDLISKNDGLEIHTTEDNLPKILAFFLAKTWNNNNSNNKCENVNLNTSTNDGTTGDNKSTHDVINDENNNIEYEIRDIYEKKLTNIDIIHARDRNGDSLFYKCIENCNIQLDTLKFLYDYAIEMNQQFPEKYSEDDVYYFVNNINPNILLNRDYKIRGSFLYI